MKLSISEREELFSEARELSPALGGLYQNEMEIVHGDIEAELILITRQSFKLNTHYAKVRKLLTRLEKG